MDNKTLIIDNRIRSIEKQKLKEMGYELIELKTIQDVYEEISSHVDIFACKVGEQIIIEPTQYENISKNNTKLICGAEKLKANLICYQIAEDLTRYNSVIYYSGSENAKQMMLNSILDKLAPIINGKNIN